MLSSNLLPSSMALSDFNSNNSQFQEESLSLVDSIDQKAQSVDQKVQSVDLRIQKVDQKFDSLINDLINRLKTVGISIWFKFYKIRVSVYVRRKKFQKYWKIDISLLYLLAKEIFFSC